jgi:DNA-binding CsgD family transcriptional regulator/tetratricopeptide (TPR) repeat protein
MLSNIGSATIRLGGLEKAKGYITRALDLQRMLGTRTRLLSTLNNLAIIHIQLGEFERAREVFEEAMAMHREDDNIPGQAQIAHGFSNLELDQGNTHGAATWFLEAVEMISGTEDISGTFDYTGLLVAICQAAGRHPEVVEILAADERLRDEVGFEITPEDRADMDNALAGAREALGATAFEAAWTAGAALDLPALMRRMPMIARQIVGRRHATTTPVNAGVDVATSWEEPGAGEIEQVLTAREVEILRLLAAGKSTTEISDELFVSARTVSTHVTHILRKLGVPNRTAAVAWAMREGLA